MTDVLGRVPGLKVVGCASAFSFKGMSVAIPEIARRLGATHLVDGTVLQKGQAVRITAKPIQADGFQVRVSDKLEREAKILSLKLGARSAAATATVNPGAFELYLQARQAWNLRTPTGVDRAESLLARALSLEPRRRRFDLRSDRHDGEASGTGADSPECNAAGRWQARRSDRGFGIRGEPRFVKIPADLDLTEPRARAQAWCAAHPPEQAAK